MTLLNQASNIIITGGAGLIGSHLCESLLNQGHIITCIDNFITGRKQNIAHLFSNSNFTFIEADVSQPPTSYQLPAINYQLIFHLASPASPLGYSQNPIATYQVNAWGTHYMCELARQHNARILYSSTSEVYGDPLQHPQTEIYWGNVNPNGPRSCYDESKRFGEMVCMTFFRKFKLDTRIVRIFNTYGPRNDPQDGRVVPNFIMQALKNEPLTIYGDGKQTRSFCYVSDLVMGIEKMMFTENLTGEVINLGNPNEFTVLELAQMVIKLIGSKSEISYQDLPPDDPRQRKPDISKAKQLLNWEPTIALEEGLKPTIEYFKQLL